MDDGSLSPAVLYDLLNPTDVRDDVPGYVARARDADGPTLELACGTGRVYLELLAAGVDADGIDVDEGSLTRLREKAAERGLTPSVRQGDMTDFAADREYGLVICPFNAVQHAIGVADQAALLERVYEALAPGGSFVFDTFVPSFDVVCETYGEWTDRRLTCEGREYRARSRTRLVDEVEQVFEVENVVTDGDGRRVHEETHRLSMLPKQQVEALARASPFDSWSVAGGFERRDIEDGDLMQLWTLERAVD